MESMARGWESKSVEEQRSEVIFAPTQPRQQLTAEQLAKGRQRESLQLARKRILNQLQTIKNARHREMLKDALAALDTLITQVG